MINIDFLGLPTEKKILITIIIFKKLNNNNYRLPIFIRPMNCFV